MRKLLPDKINMKFQRGPIFQQMQPYYIEKQCTFQNAVIIVNISTNRIVFIYHCTQRALKDLLNIHGRC